ncbi:hypothetical protein QLH51_13980 [Sphingomonas sp. 2R-10]|uniref:PDZ domain-containing protein n=1 Tax=Sphingomonas sp. 2R-10 TaxID=3045148 RepID=UPI000F78DE54|nr:PDZ domain-containing protein [Sphingomonas sp. 2R-10]MDJ0277909.1 hypothetical protein [Sphingomonas sp. 2R-10]
MRMLDRMTPQRRTALLLALAVAGLTAGTRRAWPDAAPTGAATIGATLAASAGPPGLVVTSLRTDGAAAGAGLRVGDVIDRVDGRRALSVDTMAMPEPGGVERLHVAPRGDAGARTLILRRTEVGQREDPDRRGR